MRQADELFLDALRCALHGETASWETLPVEEAWPELIRLAQEHRVLPLVLEAVHGCPAYAALGRRTVACSAQARKLTLSQAQRTADFLLLMDGLRARGLRPAVIKGVVCRGLYPHPEQRASVDEDLLFDRADFAAYHEALLALGLQPLDAETATAASDEVTYVDPARGLYIELHMSPFPTDSDAYGDCNRFFDGALQRCVSLRCYGSELTTLGESDHLLYLLCHAYKHFLHGGVGIRQVCDIALFSAAYAEKIDWPRVVSDCRALRIDTFSAALYEIAGKYLALPVPDAFAGAAPDILPLLEDILTGGLYGAEDPDRLHSSTLTLEAVAAERKGKRRTGALHSVFLPAESLQGRFPYLRRCPWLLPVAWAERVWGYLHEPKRANPAATMKIGADRIRLLKQYKILP